MQQVTYPYEILIRLGRNGIVGAQYQTITDIVDDDGVTVLASREGPVSPLALAGQTGVSLDTIMGQAASTALLENEQLKATIAQMQLLINTLEQEKNTASVASVTETPPTNIE